MEFNGFTFMFIIILTIIIAGIWEYIQKLKYIREKIKSNWGKEGRANYKDKDLESITSYYKNIENKGFYIDDITWNDLNMNIVFSRINNTQSSVGEEFLYSTLRRPEFSEDKLKVRDKIIRFFQSNGKVREEVQFLIARLGKNRKARVSEFFDRKYSKSNKVILYRILSFMPIISIGLFFINKGAFFLFILSMATNTYLHFYIFKSKEHEIKRVNYIICLVYYADKIKRAGIDNVVGCFPGIEDSLDKLKGIKNKFMKVLNPDATNEQEIIRDYLKMFFLSDLIKFEVNSNKISENTDALKNIYNFVGEIDSCISIASYRESLEYYTNPEFVNINENKQLSFKDIYHPLIDEPVSNSCEVNKSILITGSNASGKSTFIKTIAINSILAQTIYTCLAKEYKSSFFKTYSSMAIKDDILGNESYYIVEIKSLKRIIENIEDRIPCLCFIDEILRGTNTIERISASSEVLNYIANRNCLCISATHDLELTNILDKTFENYHFQENIKDNEINFDYKLYKGRSETRNAIKLLNIMGYSDDIVTRAEKRAENFSDSGVWYEI